MSFMFNFLSFCFLPVNSFTLQNDKENVMDLNWFSILKTYFVHNGHAWQLKHVYCVVQTVCLYLNVEISEFSFALSNRVKCIGENVKSFDYYASHKL